MQLDREPQGEGTGPGVAPSDCALRPWTDPAVEKIGGNAARVGLREIQGDGAYTRS